MDLGIQVQAIWNDVDVTEIFLSAWNGAFLGIARIYVAVGDLEKAAQVLRGFPSSLSDAREIVFGQFDLNRDTLASGVSMRFHCVNGAGHVRLELRLQSDNRTGHGVLPDQALQTVTLAMGVEPAAIETFVQELLRLESHPAGIAHLRAIKSQAEQWFGPADLSHSE